MNLSNEVDLRRFLKKSKEIALGLMKKMLNSPHATPTNERTPA
jgi:hypothetical protein